MKAPKDRIMSLENVIHLSKGKPKRPLSGYNIFYRLSREHLMLAYSEGRKNAMDTTFDEICSMSQEILTNKCSNIIRDYRNNVCKPKTLHNLKAISSMIGFQDLTRIIAKEWAKLIPSVRSIFESCSKEDKKIYLEKRNLWRKLKDAKIKLKLDQQFVQDEDFNDDGLVRECNHITTKSNGEDSITCSSSSLKSLPVSPPKSRKLHSASLPPSYLFYASNEDSEVNILPSFAPRSTKATYCDIGTTNLNSGQFEAKSLFIGDISSARSGCESNCTDTIYGYQHDLNQKLHSVRNMPFLGMAAQDGRQRPHSFFQLGQKYARYMSITSNQMDENHPDTNINDLRQCLLMDVFDDDDKELYQFFSLFSRNN